MAGLHDQVVVLLGYILAILIPCGTIYKMYVASLRSKKTVKEIDARQDGIDTEQNELNRKYSLLEQRLDRMEKNDEKFQDKITEVVEKLADRVYDNKK